MIAKLFYLLYTNHLTRLDSFKKLLLNFVLLIMNSFIHEKWLVTIDILFFFFLFCLKNTQLDFQILIWRSFGRSEVDNETFTEFFVIKTFIITIDSFLFISWYQVNAWRTVRSFVTSWFIYDISKWQKTF